MAILSVENLSKKYEGFSLKNVSFTLDGGFIMGFIGRNGAGKTTTLKSMLNLVHPDSGKVTMFGKDFFNNEQFCKQNIGFMLGGIDYYIKLKLKDIAGVTKRYYKDWDDALFARYLDLFRIDSGKRGDQLSAGMKIKFSLALALSHNAKLLILDEPTSGLDPVSRDEILELFQQLIEDGEKSILFSTQITSDLEKCADYITYIKDGSIIESAEKDDFLDSYKIVKGASDRLASMKPRLMGFKNNAFGFSGLIKAENLISGEEIEVMPADIESIMIYHEKERAQL